MKRIMVSFLLLMSSLSWANDACTNPEAYTIDKRCYVTEEQKKQKPYNAVATLVLNDGRTHCSGTVVKRQGLTIDDVGYFLYTAKHCVDLNHDNITDDLLRIRLPSNQEFNAKLVKQGNLDYQDPASQTGDWAKYRLVTIEQNSADGVKDSLGGAYVKINDSFARGAKNVRIIGYGKLKIMSDQEIQDFKNEYTDFIDKTGTNANDTHTDDGGIYGNGVTMFVLKNNNRFNDNLLKVSKCYQDANTKFTGCQGWGGNSGGGAFDDNGNLMWIPTLGHYQIGGKDHASITGGENFLPFGRLPNVKK